MVKHYSLILLVLLSLGVNTVAGFTVPLFVEHSTKTSMIESHSVGSHHNHSIESSEIDGHGCHGDSECHEAEDCCTKLCQGTSAIVQEQTECFCFSTHQLQVNDTTFSTYHSHSIPYFPD